MGDRRQTPGTASTGSDPDSTVRRVDSVNPGPPLVVVQKLRQCFLKSASILGSKADVNKFTPLFLSLFQSFRRDDSPEKDWW